MVIIGAGISGLLCSIANPNAVVMESGSKDDINHQAILRMKTDKISIFTGIKFKKVKVQKSIWFGGKEVQPSPRFTNMYSKKVSGKITDRSITNIDPVTRYIPPDDFIEQLQNKAGSIDYGITFNFDAVESTTEPIISTVPMSIVSGHFGMTNNFGMDVKSNENKRPIHVTKLKLKKCNCYSTIYYPDPEHSAYRASINGNILIVESISDSNNSISVDEILESFGLDANDFSIEKGVYHKQEFGKINAIDNALREKIILELTLKHNIYSLGRFATWRPKLMVDDVLDDIFVIKDLIESGKYASVIYKQNNGE